MTAGGDPPVAPATETLTFASADPYAVEADRFADAVLDGAPLPTPPEDAVANLRVVERLFAAASTTSRTGGMNTARSPRTIWSPADRSPVARPDTAPAEPWPAWPWLDRRAGR